MSYILDALRKADAQRERDSSRGIHAHPTPLGSAASGRGGRAPWLWGLGAVVIALLATGWYVSRDTEASQPAPVVAAVSPAVTSPVLAPAPAAPVAEQPAPVASAIVPAPPPPAPPQPVQAREAAFAQRTPRMGGMAPPPMVQQQAQTPQGNAPASPPVPPNAQPRPAPAVAGLPPDAPRVAISGGVYSPSPAQRMLIVNGQVFNEGSEVAPGLTIEQIKPRTAVLKFRGALYTVAY